MLLATKGLKMNMDKNKRLYQKHSAMLTILIKLCQLACNKYIQDETDKSLKGGRGNINNHYSS